MKIYYVYELIDPRNNKPFYIGKGTGKRMFSHINEVRCRMNDSKYISYNMYKFNKIKKILNEGYNDIVYKKIFESDNEKLCYEKEIEIIKEIGLQNLCNLTFGGEGTSGGITEKHKNAVRASNYIRGGWSKDKNVAKKIKWHRVNNDNYGFKNKRHTKETKEKISKKSHGWSIINNNKKYHEKAIQTLKQRGSLKGKNNGMFGRCAYDIWIEKYGIEEADKRKKEQYKKQQETRNKNKDHK